MKKIWWLLALLPGLAFGATRTWISTGSTNMNLATNYDGSGELLSTDDLLFDGTSVVNATATASLSVNSVTVTSAYTGAWSISGYTLTTAGGQSWDGTGTLNLGNGITCNGNSSTLHIGSGVGTVTASNCVVTMNTATAGVLDIDKAIGSYNVAGFFRLIIGSGCKVTTSSAAATFFGSTDGNPSLVIGNNSTLTVNSDLYFYARSAQTCASLGSNYVINGSAMVAFAMMGYNYITVTIPEITYTGTGTLAFPMPGFSNNVNSRIVFSGNLVSSNAISFAGLFFYSLNSMSFNSGLSLTCKEFIITTVGTVNFNDLAVNCTAVNPSSAVHTPTINLQSSTWSCSGNWTFGLNYTISEGTSSVTFNGTSAQSITSNGKKFNDITINNTSVAGVTFADSLRCNDLTISSGRASFLRSYCRHYVNSSNDSVFHGDTTLITGDYYRNNAKTKRTAGRMVFNGTCDGILNLVDAGSMGPILIRRAGKTLTAASAIRAARIVDSLGALKMLSYSLQCTTLTVRDTGLQCAVVTLDTLNSSNGGALGGGTITRWNWLADGLKYSNTAATKLTVGSISGFGGTSGSLDSLISTTAGAMDTINCSQDTLSYVYVKDQYMVNPQYLPETSVSGGNNYNVKTLSYTGVIKDISSGIVGATVTFTGPGFAGDCWVKFGSDSSALTVDSYTSATKAVPELVPGVYAVSVGNSDGDVVSVGDFTVTSPAPVIRNRNRNLKRIIFQQSL